MATDDETVRAILNRVPDRVGRGFVSQLRRRNAGALGQYGIRMAILALRERSVDRLREGLLASALSGAIDRPDDRDFMLAIAPAHFAATRLGVDPAVEFAAIADRIDDARLADLLRTFGARTDVTPEAFAMPWMLAEDEA